MTADNANHFGVSVLASRDNEFAFNELPIFSGCAAGNAERKRVLTTNRTMNNMNALFAAKLLQLFRRRSSTQQLLDLFERRRNVLEQQFLETASASGKPRGLRWVGCDWLTTRSLLREKSSGQLCLLAGINLSFEAIEGGEMEDVAAVSLLRDACAVFQFNNGEWRATGRTLFNMNPAEAAHRLSSTYDAVPF